MPCLENNSVMNYSDIFNFFMIILVIVSILTIFIKMPFHIILTSKVVNQDIKIDLNLRYMFNIININIPIYLRKVESKKKELEKSKRKLIKKLKSRKILARDVFAICRQLKKIDIEEFYSDVHIGNTNISITNFIYLFVNLIYGNLINIIDPNKFYMNIKPNFIENKLYIDFKIHVKPSIKNIIDILKAILIANKNSKKIKKEDKKYESNRINTIIGDPIKTDTTVVVPISKVTIGFGIGGGEYSKGYKEEVNTDKNDTNFAGGSAGAVSIQPVAFVVVEDGETRLMSLDNNINMIDNILTITPKVIEKLQKLSQNNKQS